MALAAPDPLAPLSDPTSAFKNPDQAGWLNRLKMLLSTSIADKAGRTTASDYILLRSPDGHVYQFSVSNAGAAVFTEVA